MVGVTSPHSHPNNYLLGLGWAGLGWAGDTAIPIIIKLTSPRLSENLSDNYILAMAVVMLPYLATNVPGNTIYHHNETCCLYWFAITPPCLGLASTPSSPTLYSVEAVPAPALPAEVGLLLQNAKTYFNPESGVQARIIKSTTNACILDTYLRREDV